MWAIAFSRVTIITIHLLSFMLAYQSVDLKIFIAILVEFVVEKQTDTQIDMENSHSIQILSTIAARQDISREESAASNANARSWLCSADEAEMSCQKKSMPGSLEHQQDYA